MPQRNLQTNEELDKSIQSVNATKSKHIILGDFNCPDIDWDICAVHPDAAKKVQQALVDVMTSHNLNQVQREATREGNLLDLVFSSNPSLFKSNTNIPGISDHDVIVTDSDIKPSYVKQQVEKHTSIGKQTGIVLENRCQN